MKRLLLISAAIIGLSTPALAQNGSFNGNGNSGFFNGNFNANGAGQGSGTGIGVGIATAKGGKAVAHGGKGGKASASASNSTTFQDRRQAPGIGLAGLAIGGQSCRGTATVGASFPGGSFGIGAPVDDDECERRQWAGMLGGARDPRLKALAWAIMARSKYVQQAIQDTNVVVPIAGGAIVKQGGKPARYVGGCNKWSGGALGVGSCVW